MLSDLRYSFRKLRHTPGFTVVAIAALAIGIAANTSIFSLVNSVLLRPLPYRDPGRLAYIWEVSPRSGNRTNVVNGGNFNEWRDRNHSFEKMAAWANGPVNLTGQGEPEQVKAGYITLDFLAVLGQSMTAGRNFIDEEVKPNGPNVIILGHALWMRRFGGDPAAVGKRVQVNGEDQLIVGVVGQGFSYPRSADIYMPMAPRRLWRGRSITVVARLNQGVGFEAAQSEMDSIMGQLRVEHPEFNSKWGVNVMPMKDYETRNVRLALIVLLGAVGFVLLIACANVANLMLIRATSRAREIAVRLSIGASRWAIARQLVVESLMISVASGIVGLLLSVWLTDALVALTPPSVGLENFARVTLDPGVLLFTFGATLFTGLLFGLAPAARAARFDLSNSLKGARNAGGGMRSNKLRAALVVAEVALSVVLLAGAGLLARSFLQLMSVKPGFEPDRTLTLDVLMFNRKPDQASVFLEDLLERIRAIPSVRAAGSAHFLPMTGMTSGTGFRLAGLPVPAPGDEPICEVSVITSGYFAAMSIPLRHGRVFDHHDRAGTPPVIVINETLARKYFPGQNPIGRGIHVQWGHPDVPYEIVGVAGDIRSTTLDKEPSPTVFIHNRQEPLSGGNIVIRTTSDPSNVAALVKQQIRALDPNVPVSNMRSLDYYLSSSVARQRFNTILLGGFACAAMLLALLGVFGVISYSVSQRTQEIGVRMALGAGAGDVARLVIREGMLLAGLGIVFGVLGALTVTRFISALLFGVQPTDVPTYAGVSAILAFAALVAAWLPARRASKVDPIVALRYE